MKLTYIDMTKFDIFNEIYINSHFSKETYYRLYIPKLFCNFDFRCRFLIKIGHGAGQEKR